MANPGIGPTLATTWLHPLLLVAMAVVMSCHGEKATQSHRDDAPQSTTFGLAAENLPSPEEHTGEVEWYEHALFWQAAGGGSVSELALSERSHLALRQLSVSWQATAGTDQSRAKLCLVTLPARQAANALERNTALSENLCLGLDGGHSLQRSFSFPGAGLLVPKGYSLSLVVEPIPGFATSKSGKLGELAVDWEIATAPNGARVYQTLRAPFLPESFAHTRASRQVWFTNPPVQNTKATIRTVVGYWTYFSGPRPAADLSLTTCTATSESGTDPDCAVRPRSENGPQVLEPSPYELLPGMSFGAHCEIDRPLDERSSCAIYALMEVPWLEGNPGWLTALDAISPAERRRYCANPFTRQYTYWNPAASWQEDSQSAEFDQSGCDKLLLREHL